MQLTVIEKEVLDNMHDLPLDKQQSILDFSLFIKSIAANPIQNTKPLKRQAGLGKGSTWMSEDFDEPLPDSFWLGEK
jgi:hypothetical protein